MRHSRLHSIRSMVTAAARASLALAWMAALGSVALAAPARVLVICSPGSPGTTEQAQPTMDAFAQAAARAAGLPAESLQAVYYETAEAGLARLGKDDAVLTMVPLPFLLRYGTELSLQPKLEAVQQSGAATWCLVARKGLVTGAVSLGGWEVTGAPGYAPDFVRGTLLSGWGALPADARITFSARALAALRRAAAGEKVAVLLDDEQRAALPTLPFAADLEIVTKSRPLPSGFICQVGKRLPAAEAGTLIKGLLHLHETDAGREVLETMKLKRFEQADLSALDQNPPVIRSEELTAMPIDGRGGASLERAVESELGRPSRARTASERRGARAAGRARAVPERGCAPSRAAAGLLVLTLMLTGGCARALREPPPLIEPGQASEQHPERVAPLLQEADELYAARDPVKVRRAAVLYLEAARSDTKRIEGLVGAMRAEAWLIDHETDAAARRDDAVAAVKAAQWCGQAAPDSAVCSYWLGASLGLQARERHTTALDALPKIEAAFKQAAAKEPALEQGGPDRALALLYLRAPGWPTGPGDPDLGLEHARKAVTVEPEYPPNQLALAEALKATGDADRGREAWQRALDLARAKQADGDPDAIDWIHEAETALAGDSPRH